MGVDICVFSGFVIDLGQLRAVFASLVNGTKFSIENSQRIKKIGFVIIAWAFVNPILQYFGGRAILNEYAINTPVTQLNPAFELSLMAIFIGAAMSVLSGALNEATKIHEDQLHQAVAVSRVQSVKIGPIVFDIGHRR